MALNVVVDGWVWLPKSSLTSSQMAKIKKQLTVVPRKMSDFGGKPPAPVCLYADKNGMLGVPRGFYRSKSRRDNNQNLNVSDGGKMNPHIISLMRSDGPYAEQGTALDMMAKYTKEHDWGGFLLQAGCGFGKTNVALEFAFRLRRRTLILVHKEFFLRQWRERIEQFFPGAKAGIVRQNKCDYEGKDFVIAMMQSIARDKGGKYPEEFYSAFGLVVSDECHRIGAATWAGVVPRFNSRWRLGLTATPRRKDGAEQVFFHHLGFVLYRAKSKGLIPQVKTVLSDARLMPSRVSGRMVRADDLKHVHVLAQLVQDPSRNKAITDCVAGYAGAGRKVMVVSERLKHLSSLHALLTPAMVRLNKVISIGYYVGGKTESELKEAERANVILATKQMIEEGLDIPAVDVLLMATPMSDVEQTVGRARRFCKPSKSKCEHLCPWRAGDCQGKPKPIIVDVRDHLIVQARKKRARRVGFYRGIGAKV